MYSLDINFLKDRPEYKLDTGAKLSKARLPGSARTPLYLGLGVGLLLPTLVGIGWLILQSQNASLEKQVAQVDAQLNLLGIQEQELKKNQEQTQQINAETQALVTVFNQIKPWSAMLQDIRDRIPTAVQLENIKQIPLAASVPASSATAKPAQPAAKSVVAQPVTAAKKVAAQPATKPAAQPATLAEVAPTNPTSMVEITGVARSFSDVNDFLITLQRSPFLKSTDTKIVKAELINNPIQLENSPDVQLTLPQVVRYTIQSSLSETQASELLRELERKGTLGLVTRIRTLQQKGIIQP